MVRAMDNPMPMPSALLVKNGSKTSFNLSSGEALAGVHQILKLFPGNFIGRTEPADVLLPRGSIYPVPCELLPEFLVAKYPAAASLESAAKRTSVKRH
jgi:hypothetical protein